MGLVYLGSRAPFFPAAIHAGKYIIHSTLYKDNMAFTPENFKLTLDSLMVSRRSPMFLGFLEIVSGGQFENFRGVSKR